MAKERIKKYCIRCGQSEEDVRKMGSGCSSWGKSYKRHSYYFAILRKGKDGHWYLNERKPPKKLKIN